MFHPRATKKMTPSTMRPRRSIAPSLRRRCDGDHPPAACKRGRIIATSTPALRGRTGRHRRR
jgi:hypothetical protein